MSLASSLRSRLLDAHADPRHFLRDSGGGADLEPALRQMVERADFLDNLPRLVIRQDEAHDVPSDVRVFNATSAIRRLGAGL
jgi:hypothetical protein